MAYQPKIHPLGDNCVTVDFGNEISTELNSRAVALAAYFEANRFPGFIESVPAYSSVSIFYDLLEVRQAHPQFKNAFELVSYLVRGAVTRESNASPSNMHVVEIPVDFSDAAALDMESIIEYGGVTRTETIDLFTSQTYRVFMLGFLPGFAYMGEVDDRIAIPRRDSPRKKVPKGSVGIAGRQTGIYPLESPGGWQIIGRTDLEMFTPGDERPSLLQPGDEVRFVMV